jgi:hypothetical protein
MGWIVGWIGWIIGLSGLVGLMIELIGLMSELIWLMMADSGRDWSRIRRVVSRVRLVWSRTIVADRPGSWGCRMAVLGIGSRDGVRWWGMIDHVRVSWTGSCCSRCCCCCRRCRLDSCYWCGICPNSGSSNSEVFGCWWSRIYLTGSLAETDRGWCIGRLFGWARSCWGGRWICLVITNINQTSTYWSAYIPTSWDDIWFSVAHHFFSAVSHLCWGLFFFSPKYNSGLGQGGSLLCDRALDIPPAQQRSIELVWVQSQSHGGATAYTAAPTNQPARTIPPPLNIKNTTYMGILDWNYHHPLYHHVRSSNVHLIFLTKTILGVSI